MNLQKAKEDLEAILNLKKPLQDKDYKPAIKLGSEAIKVLLHGRLIGAHHDPARLPGETQE